MVGIIGNWIYSNLRLLQSNLFNQNKNCRKKTSKKKWNLEGLESELCSKRFYLVIQGNENLIFSSFLFEIFRNGKYFLFD